MAKIATTIELDGQYRALRETAGVIDRSSRAKLVVRGPEGVDYLQGQITNDVEALAPGEGCYAALLDRKGHMRADLRVLTVAGEEQWLDAEEIAHEALLRHLEMYMIGRQVEIEDVSGRRALISVVGPASGELTGAGPLSPEHAHRELSLGGASCRAVATDLGVDLIVAAADADAVREALVGAGAPEVSEAAAEIVRVESGRPRFGAEMSTATIPAEAGINERAVNFTKGCYIGQETVARLHYKGKPNRHLRGLRLEGPVSAGEPIRLGDREVGAVGTACLSPAFGPIALAIVRREAGPGERVSVGEDGTGAEVVEPPFA
ncbi:MAG: YgfZ/GcvT domain-containing protein [Solirubrobacterales bacterium]